MTPDTAVAMAPPEAVLNADQAAALKALHGTDSLFLTGEAGTGKSFTLGRYLRSMPHRIPILASTGAAAVLVGGQTFHSFFGLGILSGPRRQVVGRAINSDRIRDNLMEHSTLVVDEVSMLSGYVLSVAEEIARLVRGNDKPWGGIRIVACGDFAQLPPVLDGLTPGADERWAFQSDVWHRTRFRAAVLRRVMRTGDTEFLRILNLVRRGRYTRDVYDFLDARYRESLPESWDGTRLHGRRDTADSYNLRRLNELPDPLTVIPTAFSGDERYHAALVKALPIPEALLIKPGALVMIRRNAPDFSFVNGTLARVASISPDRMTLDLVDGSDTVELGKCRFDWRDGEGKVVYTAVNFPVTLAWACTIHKAQGSTLDRMCVDLRGLWEYGQAYVALSRARSASRIVVVGWDDGCIRADPDVIDFYNRLEQEGDDG